MGMAGAPFPYYIGYLEPASAFGLAYAVNSIAMPMIGGTTSWIGPLIGAVLLGTLQQVATVTISSAVNLLIVGVLLVGFVIIAPNGIVGLGAAAGAQGGARSDDAPHCWRSQMLGKRFGGFVALDGIDLDGACRRAARPHRPERLRQEHAGQLHLRHAAQRDRRRAVRRPRRSTADRRTSAPISGWRAASSCRGRSPA